MAGKPKDSHRRRLEIFGLSGRGLLRPVRKLRVPNTVRPVMPVGWGSFWTSRTDMVDARREPYLMFVLGLEGKDWVGDHAPLLKGVVKMKTIRSQDGRMLIKEEVEQKY